MTRAEALRIHRLPAPLDLAERRIDQLSRTPRAERNAYWFRRWQTALAKRERLRRRAAEVGLRDLAV